MNDDMARFIAGYLRGSSIGTAFSVGDIQEAIQAGHRAFIVQQQANRCDETCRICGEYCEVDEGIADESEF
jgi:hypothetical protein